MTPESGNQPTTSRTTVRRIRERGVYDRATIHAIVDEALICHVGFVDGGQPFVIPTIHVRIDEAIYLHGSIGSRLLRVVGSGDPVCLTVTHLDGLVLARSVFHHSMNYRSVVILGSGRVVTDALEKRRALDALVEQVIPGRSADVRGPNDREFAATQVVAIPLHEASAKIRTGPPGDDENDYALPIWAGVIPLSLTPGTPEPDPALDAGISVPEYVASYARR